MKQANQDIRNILRINNIPQWKLADKLDYSSTHFSVKMRHEFTKDYKERVFKALEELKKEE